LQGLFNLLKKNVQIFGCLKPSILRPLFSQILLILESTDIVSQLSGMELLLSVITKVQAISYLR